MGPSQTTLDGYERCMMVNFLAVFYISMLFVTSKISRLTMSTSGDHRPTAQSASASHSRRLRIVNVSSDSYSMGRLDLNNFMRPGIHRGIYESYADSKLAMMLFTTELNSRHSLDGVTCLAAHPGAL
jgi:NAD(P)-dependent dehydrogenase (short-subunit alcohol dehydrogenase family)